MNAGIGNGWQITSAGGVVDPACTSDTDTRHRSQRTDSPHSTGGLSCMSFYVPVGEERRSSGIYPFGTRPDKSDKSIVPPTKLRERLCRDHSCSGSYEYQCLCDNSLHGQRVQGGMDSCKSGSCIGGLSRCHLGSLQRSGCMTNGAPGLVGNHPKKFRIRLHSLIQTTTNMTRFSLLSGRSSVLSVLGLTYTDWASRTPVPGDAPRESQRSPGHFVGGILPCVLM